MKLCIDCKFYRKTEEPRPKWIPKWWNPPTPYDESPERCVAHISPVSGDRRSHTCQSMRTGIGTCLAEMAFPMPWGNMCGPDAKLFEPRN
jgi:hypothetical protein